MNNNIEIKAKVSDYFNFRDIAESISDNQESFYHTDTYFFCDDGRLKLRINSNGSSELIFYRRENSIKPKVSQYWRRPIKESEVVLKSLERSHGIRGTIKKKRMVFFVGQTRIHLDEVENLGLFTELEVVLEPYQNSEYGIQTSQKLMSLLKIHQYDLISKSYIDLYEQKVFSKGKSAILRNAM